MLALTHISSRYAGGELREEARAVFAATEAPRDFDTIEVPVPRARRAPSWCAGPSARRASASAARPSSAPSARRADRRRPDTVHAIL